MSTTEEIRQWSEELARDPASLVFLQLARRSGGRGKRTSRSRSRLRGIERHPSNADAHDLMARIAVDRRDFERAISEWETVLRVAPDHLGAMKGLGYISFQQGRLDDAERYLSGAAAQGAGDDVSTALDTVRRSSVETTATVEPSQSTDPQWLFADLLVEEQQTALLLDANGYVLGGLYLDPDGHDLAQEIGAQLSGISDEVVRAMRHLDIGDWRSIVFETEAAVVAMAPAPDATLLVVATSRATPLGLMRRLLDRCATRAASWLEAAGER